MSSGRPPGAGPSRPTARSWYLVAIGLLGCAMAIAITGFGQMSEAVGGMQRAVMPGNQEIALPGGRSTLYFEHRSTVNREDYVIDPTAQVRCTVRDQAGRALALQQPASSVSYGVDGFAGRNIFDVQVTAPGSYFLQCEGDGRFVIAIGGGIGAWIVVAIVGGLVPGLGGVFVAVFVFLRRRRHAARLARAT